MTRALIIGGGIAGTAAALALDKAGIDAIVMERRPAGASDDAGVFFTLGSNGIDALRTLGVDAPVLRRGFPTPAIELRSYTGKALGVSRIGTELSDGTTSQTMRRADLYTTLRDAVGDRGIPLAYDKRLTAAEVTTDGVRARFADGSVERADVLLGCDGIRSVVRDLVDPNAPGPRYAGLVNHGGYARDVDVDLEPGSFRMIFGRRAFFGYASGPDGQIWWFANEPLATEPGPAELAATDTEDCRRRLRELFADDAGPAADIVAAAHHIAAPTAMHTLPALPTWHAGPMVVLGDAAHAPSPSSGQGASLSIEDAVVMAQCLRDIDDPARALQRFEQLRRPRVERIVKAAARINNSKAATGAGRVWRDLMLPLVLRMAGTKELQRTYGFHIDWDATITVLHGGCGTHRTSCHHG